jgi:hypothetical protein
MSKRAARVVRAFLWTALAAGVAVSCANAGLPTPIQSSDDDGIKDAPEQHKDAPGHQDAPPTVDAPLVDAPVVDAPPVMIDAPPSAFCNDNSGCGGGLCCFFGLCVPGTPVGANICLPNGN